MTEHLKKQIEAAAQDCRNAKSKFRSANSTIDSHNSVISSNQATIESLETSIVHSQNAIVTAIAERHKALDEFKIAEARLGFFNRELIDHPYADL